MSLFAAIVLALALVLLLFSAFRSRELFVLRVEQGKTHVLRGRVPPALLEGLSDVFARAQVVRARVRVLRDGDRARISATGLDAFVRQRARNVLGSFPMHKLIGSR